MIKSQNMALTAKVRHTRTVYFDISGTTAVFEAVIARDAPIRVRRALVYYYVATNGGTVGEKIQVGIRGSLTKYFDIAPVASTAVGTLTEVAPSSADLVAKNEALLITRSAASGQTNTGEILVQVDYEYVDGPEPVKV